VAAFLLAGKVCVVVCDSGKQCCVDFSALLADYEVSEKEKGRERKSERQGHVVAFLLAGKVCVVVCDSGKQCCVDFSALLADYEVRERERERERELCGCLSAGRGSVCGCLQRQTAVHGFCRALVNFEETEGMSNKAERG
jgi:hypothetical protein